MEIVVNHLTRMQEGFFCVAGLDVRTARHVRPLLPNEMLRVELLRREGGPFEVAHRLDLGRTRFAGTSPEVEDCFFRRRELVVRGRETPEAFWQRLLPVARSTLHEVFGEDLQPSGRTCATEAGRGRASLGCLRLAETPSIAIDSFGNLRARFDDGTFSVSVRVTDIRFYEGDHTTVRAAVVADVDRRLQRGVGVILSVGLSRAWQKPGDTVPRHWLQVNNLHLEDDPTWACG